MILDFNILDYMYIKSSDKPFISGYGTSLMFADEIYNLFVTDDNQKIIIHKNIEKPFLNIKANKVYIPVINKVDYKIKREEFFSDLSGDMSHLPTADASLSEIIIDNINIMFRVEINLEWIYDVTVKKNYYDDEDYVRIDPIYLKNSTEPYKCMLNKTKLLQDINKSICDIHNLCTQKILDNKRLRRKYPKL